MAKRATNGKPLALVVMIPAYNEESTIESVIASIPTSIPGIHSIEALVIDDGSTDLTTSIARKAGAEVISNGTNRGLAFTFSRGLDKALEMGADIIVNTDGDNQYDQKEIPALLQPILDGKADMVLGSRFSGKIESMPASKWLGNKVASFAVKMISGLDISDGQTGFRAFSREAAMKLNVFSNFTYTQETILDAADKNLRVVEVPATFRKRNGKSRLFSGVLNYLNRAWFTLAIGALKFKPIKSFGIMGAILLLIAAYTGYPVIEHYLSTGTIGEFFLLRALATGVWLILGILLIVLGFLAELLKYNRHIADRQLYEAKRARLYREIFVIP